MTPIYISDDTYQVLTKVAVSRQADILACTDAAIWTEAGERLRNGHKLQVWGIPLTKQQMTMNVLVSKYDHEFYFVGSWTDHWYGDKPAIAVYTTADYPAFKRRLKEVAGPAWHDSMRFKASFDWNFGSVVLGFLVIVVMLVLGGDGTLSRDAVVSGLKIVTLLLAGAIFSGPVVTRAIGEARWQKHDLTRVIDRLA